MEKKFILLITPLIIIIIAIFLLYWNNDYMLAYGSAVEDLLPPTVAGKVLTGTFLYYLGEFLLVIGSIIGASYVTWHWVQFSRNAGLLSLSFISSTSLLGSGIIIVILEFLGLHPSFWDFDWVFLGMLFLALGTAFALISLVIYVKRVRGK